MENWSAQLEKFRVNFFLDTNILCYLIDDTYPTLTAFIKTMAEMPVVSLFTSQYVLAELIDVRKKEDYYQEVVRQAGTDGRRINISSFITHNKRYNIPHYPYQGDLVGPVVARVDSEIEQIVNDFSINFDSVFNDQLLALMKEVCLPTKISKEDSLVLVSSLFRGDEKVPPNKVILLTNDDDFEKWCKQYKTDIEQALISKGYTLPYVENARNLGMLFGENARHWDLRENFDGKEVAREYVTSCLHMMYAENYIGSVTPANNAQNAPAHTLFLKMESIVLDNHLYTIVLDKDLNFLYCPQNQADFYYNHNSIGDSIERENRDITLGYVCQMREGEGEDIYNKLNQRGNLVFIHPDSF